MRTTTLPRALCPRLRYYLLQHGYRGKVQSFGVKEYGKSGDTEELLKAEKLDIESMTEALRAALR